MIPLRDDNPTERPPVVTVVLIVANVLVYGGQFLAGLRHGPEAMQAFVLRYGLIPADLFLLSDRPLLSAVPAPVTLLTSIFLHGGFLHLGGNMLYLWIFGDNVEDRLGHLRFLLFYLTGGVLASVTHAVLEPHSAVPLVGASGAIAAVLGAYLMLYPRARIHTLIFFGFFIRMVPVPAVVVLGLWILIQILNGLPSLSMAGMGGVAWFAHIGGFLFGVALIRAILPRRRKGRPRVARGRWSEGPW